MRSYQVRKTEAKLIGGTSDVLSWLAMTDLAELSDEDLIDLVKEGNSLAFNQLVYRHSQKYFSLAMRLTRDEQLAEEIVQEAFVGFWRDPYRWQSARSQFTTWFYRVISNRSIDFLRRQKSLNRTKKVFIQQGEFQNELQRSFQTDYTETFSTEEVAFQNLEVAIDQLPEDQKLALTLMYTRDLSQKEIAEIMKKSVRSVESLIYRAKLRLKELIEEKK